MTIYNQEVITKKLNLYLKLNKRDVKLIPGYCHGFTLLWLSKMLHGQENWYYNTIEKIVQCRTKADFAKIEVDIEKLINNIFWFQNSDKLDHEIHQLDVDKILDMPREMSLSFLFSNKQFNATLADILQHENKMVCLSGPDHNIGLFKRDGENYLFDSNYNKGKPKKITDLNHLRMEIIRCLFRKSKLKNRKIPLEINITSDFPEEDEAHKMELYSHLLEGQDSNFDKPAENGVTNLYLACESGDAEEVKFLLEKHANPNQAGTDGWFPLALVAERGYTAIVELLLKAGVDVNQCDKDQDTALHLAAQAGHDETVAYLLAHGAKPIKTKKIITPLHVGLDHHEWHIVAMMLAHIENYQDINSRDRTALRAHRTEIKHAAEQLASKLTAFATKRLQKILLALEKREHRDTLFALKKTRKIAKKPHSHTHQLRSRVYHN